MPTEQDHPYSPEAVFEKRLKRLSEDTIPGVIKKIGKLDWGGNHGSDELEVAGKTYANGNSFIKEAVAQLPKFDCTGNGPEVEMQAAGLDSEGRIERVFTGTYDEISQLFRVVALDPEGSILYSLSYKTSSDPDQNLTVGFPVGRRKETIIHEESYQAFDYSSGWR
ncbi:MAG: hypothetical protein NUV98_07220 [Candidatus Roizmanbacteria bacterium]|nr:hypothetical protein [Candidatus Roizmanbacteria bacterium]